MLLLLSLKDYFGLFVTTSAYIIMSLSATGHRVSCRHKVVYAPLIMMCRNNFYNSAI